MSRNNHQIAPRTIALRDGRNVTIRSLEEHDREALLAFGRSLPQDDWSYRTISKTRRPSRNSPVRTPQRIGGKLWPSLTAWWSATAMSAACPARSDHVGDIHLSVSVGWRRSGVGTALARAIIDAAQDLGVAKVIVEVMEEQGAGRAIFERLGFAVEGVLRRHMRAHDGQPHTLLILAYHLSEA